MSWRRELWERENPPIYIGGDRYKSRRVTKGQLVEYFNRGGNLMSPIINTEVREGADNVKVNVPYQITNVESVTTDVQKLEGIRVVLTTAKGEEGNIVLWQRPVTGKTSKMGVFIESLGNNTDKWLHKWLIIRTWQPRQRVIEVIAAPVPKAPKAPKS